MVDGLSISLFDYLQPNTGFHDENFLTIRRHYIQECGGQHCSVNNESELLRKIARRLKIELDDDDDGDGDGQSMALLRQCIISEDEEDSRTLVKYELSRVTPTTHGKCNAPTLTQSIRNDSSSSTSREMVTTLTEIDCLLTIKKPYSEISHFIRSFLLKPIDLANQPRSIINSEQEIVLHDQSVLYLFIREQVVEQQIDASNTRSNCTRFRLVKPVVVKDTFDQWEHDHLHGLFDLDLEPHTRNTTFPIRWSLSDNVSINCRIQYPKPNTNTTVSSNFDQTTATTADDEQRQGSQRRIVDWSSNPSSSVERSFMAEKSSSSLAELYANLHLIKLYFCHTLRKHRAVKKIEHLANVDMKCLNLAFQEIESEIFNDDGLFPRMREFFLPLTMSEEELHRHWSSNGNTERVWTAKRDDLQKKQRELECQLRKEKEAEGKCILKTTEVKQEIVKTRKEYSRIGKEQHSFDEKEKQKGIFTRLVEKKSKQGKRNRESIASIYEEKQQCKRRLFELEERLKRSEEEEMDAGRKAQELETEVEEMKAALKTINTKLNKKPGPVDCQLIKPPRGLILYGPPGTGKSDILKTLAKKLGIPLVSKPLAAGELNRPLVGQSEQILMDLGARCSHIPYTMCALVIDEIDSLTPQRNDNSNQGKVDKISVLLSLIEGVKDVPNLMIFSATNRLHMMDDAFLRRMSGKFFVGRPSSNSRISLLEKIPFWALEPELLDLLSIATTNFSGAAVKALAGAITIRCIKMNNAVPIPEMEALTIADQIAQHYQIYIGSETLPRLLKRNHQGGPYHPIHSLSTEKKYTGRMIVDLHEQYIRMEVLEPRAKTKDHDLSVIELKLNPNETTVQALLERLTAYGKSRNVQLLQLIDLNLLASRSAYDQAKIYETLKDRYDEYVSYRSSMIIYDLDMLVGVNKSESGSSVGASTSYTIHNQSIYTYVLSRFRDQAMEDHQSTNTNDTERWTLAIIREPYLLRQFVEDVQFPRSRRQQHELEIERLSAEKLLKCVKCHDFYIESENRMGSCNFHDGFVYDISTDEFDRCTPSEAVIVLNQLERDGFQNEQSLKTYEREKTKFKWICCNETFSCTYRGGCKRGKHGFILEDSRSSARVKPKGMVDRPRQATIQQWENACVSNDEYEEKWESLCKNV